jgi:hypothetical protein
MAGVARSRVLHPWPRRHLGCCANMEQVRGSLPDQVFGRRQHTLEVGLRRVQSVRVARWRGPERSCIAIRRPAGRRWRAALSRPPRDQPRAGRRRRSLDTNDSSACASPRSKPPTRFERGLTLDDIARDARFIAELLRRQPGAIVFLVDRIDEQPGVDRERGQVASRSRLVGPGRASRLPRADVGRRHANTRCMPAAPLFLVARWMARPRSAATR